MNAGTLFPERLMSYLLSWGQFLDALDVNEIEISNIDKQ